MDRAFRDGADETDIVRGISQGPYFENDRLFDLPRTTTAFRAIVKVMAI